MTASPASLRSVVGHLHADLVTLIKQPDGDVATRRQDLHGVGEQAEKDNIESYDR